MIGFNPMHYVSGVSLLGFLFFNPLHAVSFGVDLGNGFFKICSLSIRRSFEIVPNFQSGRKTSTGVSFADETRSFASQALQKMSKYPFDVVSFVPALLDLKYGSNTTVTPLGPYEPLHWNITKNKNLSFFFPTRNLTMTIEELLAHQFHFIATIIQRSFPHDRVEVAITLPDYAGMKYRQAVAQAASVANMTVLQFIHETPAAALYHTMSLPLDYKGKKLFINGGAWRTQACIIEYGRLTPDQNTTGYKKRTLPDVSVVWCEHEDGVGGRAFDETLADLIVDKARNQFKGIHKEPTLLKKILREAERIKIILSTNKAASVFIENFQGDKTLQLSITRKEFQERIHPIVTKGVSLVPKTLQAASLTLQNLTGVEVIGGSWRVPLFQEELGKIVHPHKLGFHLNGDEAMAFGASIMAANITKNTRFKPITFSSLPFSYIVRAQSVKDPQNNVTKLLPSLINSVSGYRSVVLTTCDDIQAELFELRPNGVKELLENYTITGIENKCKGDYKAFNKSRTSLVYKVSTLGWISLDRATATWEERYMANVTVKNIKQWNASNTNETGPSISLNNSKVDSNTTQVEKSRRHTLKCTLQKTNVGAFPLNAKQVQKIKTSLKQFNLMDELAEQLASKQNAIESYAYKSRSILRDEEIEPFIEKKHVSEHLEYLEQVLEWLYDITPKEPNLLETLDKKLKELHGKMAPILFRQSEKEKRILVAEKVTKMQIVVDNALSLLNMKNNTLVTNLTANWNNFTKWYHDVEEKQNKSSLTLIPVYNTSYVDDQLKAFQSSIETIQTVSSRLMDNLIQLMKSKIANVTSNETQLNSTFLHPNLSNISLDHLLRNETKENVTKSKTPLRDEL